MWEISILISQLPEDERRQTHENTNLSAADKIVHRVLGAQDCMRHQMLEMQRSDLVFQMTGIRQAALLLWIPQRETCMYKPTPTRNLLI